ncbi:hypothetical protein AC1031_014947 [Aphanomyces cochlioides]|nr:hypothetical protein AC1031_014947 [Aphanomyces cochlioides]
MSNKRTVWSPVVIPEKGSLLNPAVRSTRKSMKSILMANKREMEESVRMKYETLLAEIDAEIEDTKRQVENFLNINEAIYEKSTKRLKRLTDAVNNEIEDARRASTDIIKEAEQLHEKVKHKAIREFKQEATKLLQTKG